MEFIFAKSGGFCHGVKKAVDTAMSIPPENVYVFNSSEIQVQRISELGVQVCGYAFMSSNIYNEHPLADFTLPEFDGASILCAHGELNISNSRFAPIMESEVVSVGFDYAALGHVHTSEIKRVGDSVIAYCGVIEGRAFDELGECGGIELFIDGGRTLFSDILICDYNLPYASVSADKTVRPDKFEIYEINI